MFWPNLFHKWSGSRISNPRRKTPRARPLMLEALESRVTPTVSWISTQSGDWGTASNWSTGAVPGPNDDVVIDQPANLNVSVTISSTDTASCHSISVVLGNALDLTGSSLTVGTGGAYLNGLCNISNNSTLAVENTLGIGGTLDLSSGSISVESPTGSNSNLGLGGTLDQEGGTITVGARSDANPSSMSLGGIVNFQGGTISVNGNVWVYGGVFQGSSSATLALTGSLMPASVDTNPATIAASGFPFTILFDGSGTDTAPQVLTDVSKDFKGADGFQGNFAYGTIELAQGTYVTVQDQVYRSEEPPAPEEAVYIGNLIVPSGATFNLGRNIVYAQQAQTAGTILEGQIKLQPAGASPPTPVYWSSAQSGDWGTASNWSTGQVPGSNNDVYITQPNITVTLSSGETASVNSIQVSTGDALALAGGSLTAAAQSTIKGTCAVNSATSTITVFGNLTVLGTLDIEAGTTSIDGDLNIGPYAILEGSSSGTLELKGSLYGYTAPDRVAQPLFACTLLLDGTGTVGAPQVLTAMSLNPTDLGMDPAVGFQNNFVYATIALANGTVVEDSAFITGNQFSEAIYVDNLIVPTGTTFEAGPVYAERTEITGTVLGLGITIINPQNAPPPSGPPQPPPGHLTGNTVSWTSTQSGDWGTAGNWSTGQVPGPNDDVVISTAANITVTISASDSATCNSLQTIGAELDLTGGTLSVGAGGASIGGPCVINDNGSTLTVTGSSPSFAYLVVTGSLDLKAGSISVLGGNSNGAYLTVEGGTLKQEGGTIDVDAQFVIPEATFSVQSGNKPGLPDVPGGTLDLEAGTLRVNGDAYINGIFKGSSSGTLEVTGRFSAGGIPWYISTNDATWYSSQSAFPGTVLLDGAGVGSTLRSSTAQTLFATSPDIQSTAGFQDNLVYGTIEVANNSSVALGNPLGSTLPPSLGDQDLLEPAAAIYVEDLIVQSGSTLNLNGCVVYAHKEQINGTILGGKVILVDPAAGPPTTVYWIANQGGDWSTASNWSTGQVPGPNNDVIINQPESITVTLSSGDMASVNSIQTSTSDALLLDGGSLTVAASFKLEGPCTINETASMLTVSGNLFVNGLLDLEAGTVSIGGNLEFGDWGELAGSPSATLQLAGSLLGHPQIYSPWGFSGTLQLDGSGWFYAPQYLAPLSGLIGSTSEYKFQFGIVQLGNNTCVDMAPSISTVFAKDLQVPSTSTLIIDNGLDYVEEKEISGTVIGGNNLLIVTPGPVSPSMSNLSIVDADLATRETTTVTLIARDASADPETSGGSTVAFALGNGTASGTLLPVVDHRDGTYTATFTATTLGTNTITATIDGQAVTTTPPTFTVVPGPASPSHSAVALGSTSFQAGGTTTVTLTARDAYGNQESSGGLAVTFGLGSGSGGGTFSAVTDNGDGTYTASFSATIAGTDVITATMGGQAVTSAPPTLNVAPGPVSLSQSAVSLPTPTLGAASTTTVTLTSRDGYGNQETSGGLTVAFGLATASAGGTFGAVTDQGNGTYKASLTAGTTLGSDIITTTIGGQPVTSAAPTLTVTPASLILIGPANVATHTVVSFTVVAADALGNPITGYTGTVQLSSSDNLAVLPAAYAFQATDAGQHNFTVTFRTAGNQIVSVNDAAAGLTAQQTLAISPGDLNLHFVDQLYVQLLHRAPDAFGEQAWWLFLLGGGTREQAVRGFLQSAEYNTNLINSLYESFLGRMPDPTGLHDFLNLLTSPPAPGADPVVQFESALLGSAEFYQKVGSTNDAFLRALYTDVLGRAIDPSGAAAWTAALAQGQSRTAVAQQVLASGEADQDFVQGYYHQFLGRGADTGGLNSFVASLLAGTRHDDVIVGFLASDEFFNRF